MTGRVCGFPIQHAALFLQSHPGLLSWTPPLYKKKKENILFTGCLSLHSHQLFILSNFFLGQLSQLFSRFVRSELCFHDAPLYEIRLN